MAETQEATYKQLNCPICLETFKSLKILACLHTFCEKYICRHVRILKEVGTQSDIIRCPICRSPTTAPSANQTPDEWAAKLATNSIIWSLLALSNNLESIEQKKIAITKSIQDWTITMKKLIDRLETVALKELNLMCKQENI
ncbi:hypothetical protein CHS0354_029567 [Potamilus streckersoni]|uniref:RING-type domain-containing protein n=1 Tax=Potamilus streckersoni TaxID=2493646 RepID=A0AAE0VT68_9BIVA|nr:hypothetical protein CHS0354_029567 [Potamilus streckersoni]